MMAKFMQIVRERPEALQRPNTETNDRSINILSEIQRSGAMNWYSKV